MRRRHSKKFFFALGCVASAIAGGACVDIFHSTDFAQPSTGPIDFCAWPEATAQSTAQQACALLSACQSPVGDNALGTCLVNASLAYDCAANPNRPVVGVAHDYWECLARAKSCGDVAGCVYASPPESNPRATAPTCGGDGFTACAPGVGATTRLDCPSADNSDGKPAFGETCLASGHACFNKDQGEALCLGSEGITCTRTGCDGTELNFCVDAGGGDTFDRGVDCASYGAGKCVSTGDAGLACLALDGGACTIKNGISCSGSIAEGCGSGVQERVDCSKLGGGDAVTCNANPNAPAYDVASACFKSTPPQCTADTCANGAVAACVRGATVTVDCSSLGLGPCAEVQTTDGTRPACGKP